MKTTVTQRLGGCAVALLVASCSFIPPYERPEAPIASVWAQGGSDVNTSETGADIPWQRFFADGRLKELIALALDQNRDLRSAELAIEQARALYAIRRADQFPTLNAAASGSRAQTVVQGETRAVTTYSVGLLVSAWEIDFFGRVESLKQQALAQYLATAEGANAARISLIASVANTWLALLADEELLDLTRQTLESRKESQRLAKLRFDNGASSELDFRQAESLAEAAYATLAALERQRALDANALTLLVGQPIDPFLGRVPAPGQRKSNAMALADVPAGLPSDLLARRPDIRQAEQQLIAANANIGAARAAFFPRITLTAGLGTISTQLSGLFKGGSFGATAAPQAVLPLFDFGRNEANLEAVRVQRRIAVAQYEKTIQTAFREVADALAGRATLGEQLRATEAQARAEAVRFRLADMRYQSGISNYLERLDAQRALFAVQQSVVQVRLLQLQNRVQLYRALGGGWADATPPPAPMRTVQGARR